MSIEKSETGAITITGRGLHVWQLLQWKYAIRLEEKGIHVARRSVTAHAKKRLGVKGNRAAVLARIEEEIDRASAAHDF